MNKRIRNFKKYYRIINLIYGLLVFIAVGYFSKAYLNSVDAFFDTADPKVLLNTGYGISLGSIFLAYFAYNRVMFDGVIQGTIYKKLKYYFYAFLVRILIVETATILNTTFFLQTNNKTFLVFSLISLIFVIIFARPRLSEISEDLILTNPELTYVRNPEKDFFDE
jgi:hypothetical protein